VLLLYDVEELSYEEIARVLNIPIGTVKSRLNHARTQIQRHVAAYLNDASKPAGTPPASEGKDDAMQAF